MQLYVYSMTNLSRYVLLEEHSSVDSGTSNLYSQAMAFANLAESPALKKETIEGSDSSIDTIDDKPSLLSVLPVSIESAGLRPIPQGEATGSDIVLEAVLEAEVARNAKEFFSQPQIRSNLNDIVI